MAQGSGSYYEDYMRSSALSKHCGAGNGTSDPALGTRNAKKLLTDRGAYISFLEVQLERVSAACLTTQSFEARLSALESGQAASCDKLGSLSKVLRLNQELVEQSQAQTRDAAAIAADRVDVWLDKLSTELRAQESRSSELEQRLHRCDEVLQALVDAAQEDRERAASEADELRGLVFGCDARLEDVVRRQNGAESLVEELREMATTGLRKELGLMRGSLSEKTMRMEQALSETRSDLEQLVTGVQAVVDASVSRACDGSERQLSDLRQQVRDHQRVSERETAEVKGVLKKCLETQHMLSATVVAVQSEVDSALQSRRSASDSNSAVVVAAVDELSENQEALRNALRILETCAKDEFESTSKRVQALARQLETTEDAMEKVAHESLDRVDEMRQKVVKALDQVEKQVKADADAVSSRAVEAVETRVRAIERDLAVLQSHFSIASKHGHDAERTRVLTGALTVGTIVEPVSGAWNNLLLPPAPPQWPGPRQVDEDCYLTRIQELERQLHQRAQEEEERRLILQRSTQSRASSASSSAVPGSCQSELLGSNRRQGSSKSTSGRSEGVSTSGSERSSSKSRATAISAAGARKKKSKKSELDTDRTRQSTRSTSRAQELERGSTARVRSLKTRPK